MQLTSTKNPLLQAVRRAAADGRPTENGLIVAEGPHLLTEAWPSPWRIEQIFATPQARDRHADLLSRIDAEILEVAPRAFSSIAATETSQELLFLLRPKTWMWPDLVNLSALIIVLDAIQDPGNAGAIVRSADAFGATGVVLLKGCARIANGKFLRATAGSIFRVPYLEAVEPAEFLAHARQTRLALYALTQHGGAPLPGADLCLPCALAAGSEGRGLSPQLLAEAHALSIPTAHVESLNAAVACSIALFEASRQRSSP